MKTSDKIEEKMLEAKISEILHKIGIPAHISGYRHIIEAILMVVYDKNRMTKINDLIYQEIANKNKKSKSAVERAMKRAIEIAWERGNLDYINEIFGYTINPQKGKPTNKEFIAMIANKITMEML